MSNSSWLVAGQSKKSYSYIEEKLQDKCFCDLCFYRWPQMPCRGLGNHLYSCYCPDLNLLCKHTHKIYSYCHRNLDFEDEIGNFDDQIENNEIFSEAQPNPPEFFNIRSVQNKIQSRKCLTCTLLFSLCNKISH